MRYWHEFWPQVLSIAFAVGTAGNLVAAVIWATPALTQLHRKLDRQHAERMDLARRHHREQMKALGADPDAPGAPE